MWCKWRARNDRSFEDCEMMEVELEAFSSKLFTNGKLPIIVLIFLAFLISLIFFSIFGKTFLLYISYLLELRHFVCLINFYIKKEKEKKRKERNPNFTNCS
jgi:purine-cytosine permease-like protein